MVYYFVGTLIYAQWSYLFAFKPLMVCDSLEHLQIVDKIFDQPNLLSMT